MDRTRVLGGPDQDGPSKIAFEKMLRGGEARGIVFRVPQTRDADPHVCWCLVHVDAACYGHATAAQTACKAQHPRQAADPLLSFGRELRELFVPGCWLRTPVIADHLREELPAGDLPTGRRWYRPQEGACRFVPGGPTPVYLDAMEFRGRKQDGAESGR